MRLTPAVPLLAILPCLAVLPGTARAQQGASDSVPAATLASAATPGECHAAVTELIYGTHDVLDKQGQAGVLADSVITHLRRQIRPRSQAYAAVCAEQFDRQTIEPAQLGELVRLYVAAGLIDSAVATTEQRVALAADPAAEAQALSEAVASVARARSLTAAELQQLEQWVAVIDTLGGAPAAARATAHVALYYRYREHDTLLVRQRQHGERALAAARAMTPEQRRQSPRPYVSAHYYSAEVRANSGDIPGALAQLDQAIRDLPDTAVNRRLRMLQSHFARVGQPAAPVSADVWFNTPADMQEVAFDGKVTLLVFGHVWCGYSLRAAPIVQRLQERYGAEGFQAVLLAEIAGAGAHRADVDRETELAYHRHVWVDRLGVTYPIGIGDTEVIGKTPWGDDARSLSPAFEAYGVRGYPILYLVDQSGVVRYVSIDAPPEAESYLGAMIERYLEDGAGRVRAAR